MTFTRRTLLTTSIGAGLAVGVPSRALSQQRELTVGTWGGDYAQLLRTFIDEPIMRPKGVDVSQIVGVPDTRRAKLLAERQTNRGSMDVVCLDDTDSYVMASQKLLSEVSDANVPRYKNILPNLRTQYSVPQIFSVFGLLYNPAHVPTAPRHLADVWDLKYRGRIGLVDISYQYYTAMAALVGGGSVSNYDPAKGKLRELKALNPKIYPSVEGLATGLKAEEVWIAPFWIARGFMWQKAGLPIKHVVPEGDILSVSFHGSVARNTRNSADAFRYLDAMLDPAAQVGFGMKLGYLPTVSDAKLPDDIAAELNLSEAERARVKAPDYGYVAAQLPSMLEFWNREFKA